MQQAFASMGMNIPMSVRSNVPHELGPDAPKTHHNMLWVPRRCEVAGCGEKGTLKACAGCKMVMYCSREHQRSDWQRHRVECSHLRNLGLWPKMYNVFEQCPCAGCTDRVNGTAAKLKTTCCNICGATEDLVKAPCCGVMFCNTEYKNYQMGSYSREFCLRSHMRYTLCDAHKSAKHHDEAVCERPDCTDDVRDCGQCRWMVAHDSGKRWQATNGYNVVPPFGPDKGLLLTDACTKCGGRVHTGMENFSQVRSASGGDPDLECEKCRPTWF